MRACAVPSQRRALSSVGQSRRLIISWSQVQALQGAHFGGTKPLQNARACVSSRSVSTEAELRGHLAQLVQSARLTRERSLVRVQYCPQPKRSPARKCGVFVGSLFKPAQRRRRKKPRTGVQGFKVGNRKESESVGDTNLNVRQHCPSKVVANVFNFELNFFFMLFHLLSMSGVFNTGTTSG